MNDCLHVSPITSQQEQSRYAWFGGTSICDHIKVLAVIVLCIISNQNSFAPCFLHMLGLLYKGATAGVYTETEDEMVKWNSLQTNLNEQN